MQLCWIIGAGGFLGSELTAELAVGQHTTIWKPDAAFPWGDKSGVAGAIEMAITSFLREAASADSWKILWCAGAGVVASPEDALVAESRVMTLFLDTLAERLECQQETSQRGALFLASSAGGVYGDTRSAPPFDESTATGARSPYGREKLAQEASAEAFAARVELPLLIGRFSNLYGPGQNPHKPQGLITYLVRAALRREPLTIYVPLDTIRDYLFITDAARMVVRALHRLDTAASIAPAPRVTKIFASEVGTSVAGVLGAWRGLLHKAPRVVLARHGAAALQPPNLSFRSSVWPDILGTPTLLPLGLDIVRRYHLTALMDGRLI